MLAIASVRPGGIRSINEAEIAGTRSWMAGLGVRAVVVTPSQDPRWDAVTRKVYGAPSEIVGGVEIWWLG